MARSRWKLSYFTNAVWRKLFFLKRKKRVRRKIFYDRSSTIPTSFFYSVLRIHKGKRYRKFLTSWYSLGYKMGEFSYTRKPYHFPVKRSKKKKILLEDN